LDDQLRNLNRRVLAHGGHIKMSDAKKHAERQYEKFNSARKLERQKEADPPHCRVENTGQGASKIETTITTKTVTVAGSRSVIRTVAAQRPVREGVAQEPSRNPDWIYR
jgi:hypothetical protein